VLAESGGSIAPSGNTFGGPAKVLTPAQMNVALQQASRAPVGPINRPTIPLDQYRAAKAAAASEGFQASTPGTTGTGASGPTFGTNFTGAVEGENSNDDFPPDADSAVGPSQILQPTNSSIDIWTKTGSHLHSISENSFVGNTSNDALGDGRAIYDAVYNRWIVLMADFSNVSGSGRPLYYLAVSQTSDATGAYFVFAPNVSLNLPPGEVLDFPQLGLDQDALLITANTFNRTEAFTGSIVFAIPKALAYNGRQYSVPIFRAPIKSGTLAPPLVEDNNGADFFVAVPMSSPAAVVQKFTMKEAGRSNVSFSGPTYISVPSYREPPPNANQTCTGSNTELQIDTSDGRFENRSYQYGVFLWQTHPVNQGGRSVPVFYEFNTTSNSLVQRGMFSASATSFDFNPHIAADTSGNAIVSWTATEPTAGKDALVMFAGRTSTTPLGVMLSGPTIAGSTSCLADNYDRDFGNQRWGDYSAANLDPASPGSFWVTNEKIAGSAASGTDYWATHHARVTP